MLFQTTQAHEELRAKVRAFAEEEIKPIAFMLDQQNEFPDEAIRKLGEMGLMGIPFPAEYGGAGLDALSYAIAVEELARVDGGAGVILSAHVSLGSWPIFAYGTEEQKRKYLVPLAKGEKIGAFGLTEPNAGSDAGGTETTAVLKGDHYVLNGGKIFITNAPKADTYVVFAVTTPDIGTRGISAFIVEKGWKGFYFGDHYDKMGIRSSSTAELIFDNVEVPRENLLGKEGDGFKIAMSTLDGGRIGIAAQALGIAQGAYDAAVAYSKERIQFGKPIGFQQAISFKIADMATKLRCARFLVYSAAELKEAHAPYGMESAMAKMYASDIALEVTNDALQIHGGAGFMKGMEVERAYRDAKITTIYEGTNEIQRVVIASHILGKAPKSSGGSSSQPKKPAPVTGVRKKVILRDGSPAEQVAALVEHLKKDGHDFTVGIPLDTPIAQAELLNRAETQFNICLGLCVGAGAALYLPRPVLAAGAAGGTGVSVSVLSAQDAFIFAPSTQAQANAEANKAQSEQAAMENEAGTAQTQPAAQMGQVPAEARRLTVTQEGASAILQALCSAARTPTLRENLPDAPGQQAFYVTLRTGNAAQVVCLTPQAAFVQAKTENAVVYRIADGAGLYEAVRAACL